MGDYVGQALFVLTVVAIVGFWVWGRSARPAMRRDASWRDLSLYIEKEEEANELRPAPPPEPAYIKLGPPPPESGKTPREVTQERIAELMELIESARMYKDAAGPSARQAGASGPENRKLTGKAVRTRMADRNGVKTLMQVVVSLAILGAALWTILSGHYDDTAGKWASASAATIVGFWLGRA